jgi:hypothetical protein
MKCGNKFTFIRRKDNITGEPVSIVLDIIDGVVYNKQLDFMINKKYPIEYENKEPALKNILFKYKSDEILKILFEV